MYFSLLPTVHIVLTSTLRMDDRASGLLIKNEISSFCATKFLASAKAFDLRVLNTSFDKSVRYDEKI